MNNITFTALLVFIFFTFPAMSWGQCTTADCPNNDNACNNDPDCCLATGATATHIDDCLATPGVSIIRVKYNATISNGVDATNALICLTGNNNLSIANNVIVDNTTCIAANGNNDVIVNVNGEAVAFNAGPELDALNNALASLPGSATIQNVVIALPVQLVSYTVKTAPQGMLLEWVTATENNNKYFLLERSTDGKEFDPLANIPAQGDGLQTQHYQFIDNEVKPGFNYYRLTQFDYDGSKTILGIVQSQKNSQVFSFAPNPVASGNRISLFPAVNEAELAAISFQLTNTLGQVWPLTFEGNALSIPNGLSKGLYYLTIIKAGSREALPITIN